MDKVSKAVLQYMSSRPSPASDVCLLDDSVLTPHTCTVSDIASATGYTRADILLAVRYLVSKNHAEYDCLSSASGKIPVSFRLLHTGVHHKEFRVLRLRELWGNRIVSFLLGVASGLLVAWLSGLLKLT